MSSYTHQRTSNTQCIGISPERIYIRSRIITQYGSTVYIGMPWFGQHYSVLKEVFDDHFQFVVYGTSNKLNVYMCSINMGKLYAQERS